MTSPIIVGTRGSELALVQATATEAALAAAFPHREIIRKVIKTTGDRRTDVSLAEVAKAEGTFDKGVFIKEIEEALDAGEIDIAVHSLKDLPTVLGKNYQLAAVLERAPVRDVLVMKTPGGLSALPAGATVGTSSVRRAKQIQWLRPDLRVIDLRGNVPTRLHKLGEVKEYDAILLAEAGLVRLDTIPRSSDEAFEEIASFPGLFVIRLAESEFFPAAGQGAIGLEVRAGDTASQQLAEAIGHAPTWTRIRAEREFLRLLDGGCHTPVGVYSSLSTAGEISLSARVFPDEGGAPRSGTATGTDPILTAHTLFHSLS